MHIENCGRSDFFLFSLYFRTAVQQDKGRCSGQENVRCILSYRFKPDLEQSIWNETKEPSEMLRSSRMNNLEQKSNEPTRVKINFRANPNPTDCRWKITKSQFF